MEKKVNPVGAQKRFDCDLILLRSIDCATRRAKLRREEMSGRFAPNDNLGGVLSNDYLNV